MVFYFAYRAFLKIVEAPDFRLGGFLTQKSSHIWHKGGISDFSNKPMAAGICCKKGFYVMLGSLSKAVRRGRYSTKARRKFAPAWMKSKGRPAMAQARAIEAPPKGR